MKKTLLNTLLAMLLCQGLVFAEHARKSPWKVVSMEEIAPELQAKLLDHTSEVDYIDVLDLQGTTIYRAHWTADGVQKSVSYTDLGYLVRTDEMVNSADVPEKIQNAVQAHWPKAADLTWKKAVLTIYQASPASGASYRLTPTGRVYSKLQRHIPISKRVAIEATEVPANVMETLSKFAEGNVIEIAFKKTFQDYTTYGIQWTQNGVKHTALAMDNGDLIKVKEDITDTSLLPEKVVQLASKRFPGEQIEYEKEGIVVYEAIQRPFKGRLMYNPAGVQVEIQHDRHCKHCKH